MGGLFKTSKPKIPKPKLPPEPEKPQPVDLDEQNKRRRGIAANIFAGFGTLGQPGAVVTPTVLGG